MADPKFAGLPGIAVGEPDIYETSELPEDEQHITRDDTDSESVAKITAKPEEIFDKFKGKYLDSSAVDFSDKLDRSKQMGYYVDKTEYELAGEGRKERETPQQKCQRIQVEMRELLEEIKQIQVAVKDEAMTEKANPVVLAKQVEYLQKQLSDLQLESILGSETIIDGSDPQGALHRKLISQIEAFKPLASASTGKTSAKTDAVPSKDCVTYELYYKPEQVKFSQSAKVADLEARLERLEAVLGSETEVLTCLSNDTSGKGLVEVSKILNSKLTLLEASTLDQVEARLQAMNQKLNQIAEKKAVVDDIDSLNKVSELYELMMKWEHTIASLPTIVERMTSLKDLHEQALQFSQTLSYLDSVQQQLGSSLKSNEDLLKSVQFTFAQNLSSIRANCESLDSRLKVLNK